MFNLHRNTLKMKDYFEGYFNFLSVYNTYENEEYLYFGVALNEARILDFLEKESAYKLLVLVSNKEKYFALKSY